MKLTMCGLMADGQWIDHHDESGIFEHHSFLPELRSLAEEPWMFLSQTEGTLLGQPDPRTAKLSKTTESE